MAATRDTIRNKMPARLRDDAGHLGGWMGVDIDQALDAALAEFSRDRPRSVVVEVTGAGSFDVLLSSVGSAGPPSSQWSDGWSHLESVVYPYVSTSRELPTLEPDAYGVIQLPAGPTLRFAAATPAASEKALLTFTRPHELTSATSTVPDGLEEALVNLAAAFGFEQLAAYYAQATDSSISADVVDHRGRSSEYQQLAKVFRSRYYTAVGRGVDGKVQTAAAASAIVDLDRRFGNLGRTDYHFHPRVRF